MLMLYIYFSQKTLDDFCACMHGEIDHKLKFQVSVIDCMYSRLEV